jgi:plasmid stability protein
MAGLEAQVRRPADEPGLDETAGVRWYQSWYHQPMAMTLRLDEQETEALRKRAEREGRSMQDVARQAVRDYVERTSQRELLDSVLDQELPRYAEALERLGK